MSMNKWRSEVGLEFIHNPGQDALENAIKFSQEQIGSFSLEELDQILLVLSNYALYISSELGRFRARVRYAQKRLDMDIFPISSKYSAGHAGERKAIAISKNNDFKERHLAIVDIESKILMLEPIYTALRDKIFVINRIYDRKIRECR